MADDSPYQFTLSMNVLNHLGINLYSNVPAVLAEVVANAWDADAKSVDITIDLDNDTIQITDTGHGMDQADINGKYLTVGYRRRAAKNGSTTSLFKRPVMGRKGIGKLSLFSIANLITVHSVKNGEKNGFQLDVKAIREAIEKESAKIDKGNKEQDGNKDEKIDQKETTYRPKLVPAEEITITKGTRIILQGLSKRLNRTEDALRRRLARRFSVIGSAHNFQITINSNPITVADRDYLSKLECLWTYGPNGDANRAACSDLKIDEKGI